jgi:hypothetical protein
LKLTGTSGDHFKLSDIADLEELDQRSDQTQELVTVAKGATLQFCLDLDRPAFTNHCELHSQNDPRPRYLLGVVVSGFWSSYSLHVQQTQRSHRQEPQRQGERQYCDHKAHKSQLGVVAGCEMSSRLPNWYAN